MTVTFPYGQLTSSGRVWITDWRVYNAIPSILAVGAAALGGPRIVNRHVSIYRNRFPGPPKEAAPTAAYGGTAVYRGRADQVICPYVRRVTMNGVEMLSKDGSPGTATPTAFYGGVAINEVRGLVNWQQILNNHNVPIGADDLIGPRLDYGLVSI